jgi:hypothetical protein
MRIRFSIAGLMASVLFLAIGFAALRAASLVWASAVFTLAVVLFAAAILATATCRGPSRIAWMGFAVFGWTYLLATFWLWPAPNGVTAPPFLTKVFLDSFQPPLHTANVTTIDPGPTGETSIEIRPNVATTVPGTANLMTMTPFSGRVINLLHYRRIGHTLVAIVLGLFGALLGALLSARGVGGWRVTPDQRPATRRVGMVDQPTNIVE